MENKKYSNTYNEIKSVCPETVLSKEQFKEFYTFLNIIKPYFNDLCIVNGQFRTRSNDLTCIVETEFSYFERIDFNITDIKMLVKMLSTLDKKTAIMVVIDNKNVSFTDGYQNIQINNPGPEFIDNKFVADEEVKKTIFEDINVDKPFIKETLPKSVVCNINKITRDLHTSAVKIKHTEDDLNSGYIFISNNNNTREFTIKLKEVFLIPMEKDHYFNVTSLPFIFNKADMTINFYIKKGNTILGYYNTSVDGLLINIYCRSAYSEEGKKKNSQDSDPEKE